MHHGKLRAASRNTATDPPGRRCSAPITHPLGLRVISRARLGKQYFTQIGTREHLRAKNTAQSKSARLQ